MSSSVLNQRLRELRAAGVLESGAGGYGLTGEGRVLLEIYAPLEAWAERWAARAQGRQTAAARGGRRLRSPASE
jgi:DNA-binding HxlR family transcriptional regulator